MPRYKLYSKDGKSSREVELRPTRIEIRILPLLLCFVLAIVIWCYASGSSLSNAESQIPAETSETTASEALPSDAAEPDSNNGDAKPADV